MRAQESVAYMQQSATRNGTSWSMHVLLETWGAGDAAAGMSVAKKFLPIMVKVMRRPLEEALLPDEEVAPAGTCTTVSDFACHAGAAAAGVPRLTAFLTLQEKAEPVRGLLEAAHQHLSLLGTCPA